jgi:hypothetical protein
VRRLERLGKGSQRGLNLREVLELVLAEGDGLCG